MLCNYLILLIVDFINKPAQMKLFFPHLFLTCVYFFYSENKFNINEYGICHNGFTISLILIYLNSFMELTSTDH